MLPQRIPAQSFVFVRHGQTDWNVDGLFQGHTDVPLNANGRTQAEAAAEVLVGQKIDAIITSPLSRARDTASAIAARLGKPVHVENNLIECDFGSLEGKCYAEVMRDGGADAHRDLIDLLAPDGEQWNAVLVRAAGVVTSWLETRRGESLVFVGHDAILQALSEQLIGEWFHSRHAAPYRFSPAEIGWTIEDLSPLEVSL